MLEIDNRKPEDPNYPNFGEFDFIQDKIIYAEVGEYLVNTDGDIVVVTSSNKEWENDDSAVASWNKGFFRARYLGCRDDFLGIAGWYRIATKREVAIAEKYSPAVGAKITTAGQVQLL